MSITGIAFLAITGIVAVGINVYQSCRDKSTTETFGEKAGTTMFGIGMVGLAISIPATFISLLISKDGEPWTPAVIAGGVSSIMAALPIVFSRGGCRPWWIDTPYHQDHD